MSAVRKEKLIELLEPPVQALGYELVDLDAQMGGQGLLRIYIDRTGGVGLADCERVSRQVSALLDVEDPLPGRYVLEVSSPGVDRPLRTLEHFQRFRDEIVRIRLRTPQQERRKLTGRLRGVQEKIVLVEVDGDIWRVEPANIESAQLVASC